MAIDTSAYFSNSQPSTPIIGPLGNIYRTDSKPELAIGTPMTIGEREFRYAHFSGTTNRGLLVGQDISVSGALDANMTIVAPGSAVTTTDGTSGSKFVEITDAGVTAGDFRGAYLSIIDETGEGFTYRIKNNTTTGDPASGNYRLELHDPLAATLAADSQTNIVGSLYANLVGSTADDCPSSGVTCATMAADEYGWIQTRGFATVLADAAGVAAGVVLTISDGVAGAVQLKDAETEQIVGYCVTLASSGEHCGMMLQLG